MIIARAPLRISLGGGGTDLPSYYEKFGSMFLSAAIDKYVYISLQETFDGGVIVKYSETERCVSTRDIKHPLVREAMSRAGVEKAIEMCSFADIPAGTGLGSSGAFTVALLKALYSYRSTLHDAMSLAEDACDIEINRLKNPVGKQDQYIASVGGLTCFEITTNGKVSARSLRISRATVTDLEDHLALFFTGYSREASTLLRQQDEKTTQELAGHAAASAADSVVRNLHHVRELGVQTMEALEKGDLNEFGRIMDQQWEAKKKRAQGMSNPRIDGWYELAKQHGSLGGKLIGAGGGGFLMFLVDDKRRLRRAMTAEGLKDVPFGFDRLGAQVMLNTG